LSHSPTPYWCANPADRKQIADRSFADLDRENYGQKSDAVVTAFGQVSGLTAKDEMICPFCEHPPDYGREKIAVRISGSEGDDVRQQGLEPAEPATKKFS
jgi:hypothetical protein